ncbi:MAG TPA: hypothetical protein VMR37_04120 [Rhabdochlamydiaceae bacterium]|nr:hypothetical protein [Rhabdochlamydiaceae bacterium]
MALKLFTEVGGIICRPFHRPPQTIGYASENIVKFTGRYAIFTGCSAVILGILIKGLKPSGSLPRHLFTISWSSCATSTAVLAFFIYYCVTDKNNDSDKRNRDTLSFERKVRIGAACGALASLLPCYIFEKNNPLVSITQHVAHPLAWCSFTAAIIWNYHNGQMDAVSKKNVWRS